MLALVIAWYGCAMNKVIGSLKKQEQTESKVYGKKEP
jgi:hypothetical protein